MSKITIEKNKVIIDGHANDLETCNTLTNLCDELSKSDKFRTVKYESGYGEFDSVEENEERKFPPTTGYVYIYSNDGSEEYAMYQAPGIVVLTTEGVTSDAGSDYTYSGSKTFAGLSTTKNATIPEYVPGNRISIPDNGTLDLYIVEGNVVVPALTAHKTLVGGTVYTVKGGKCMVNGTVYNILKGRTLINGTGYDITLPSAGTKLSTLDVGQSVFANVNGKKTEFLVVHQGKPSSIYDDSCNGTWLLMKDIYENRAWHSSNVNKYESSDINTYLNGPFFNLFDSNIQGIIKQVKIPYRKNGGYRGTDQSGANGLPCKVFLLSGYEVGWTTSDNGYFPEDGAKLAYFESGTGTSANHKRIAYLNGSAAFWWLRSPYTDGTSTVFVVDSNSGRYRYNNTSFSYGIRPALILPSDALVDDEFNLIA